MGNYTKCKFTDVLIIKKGVSLYEINECYIDLGEKCLLVYNRKNECIGVVWDYQRSANDKANGRAEIYFFNEYRDIYGTWHRMYLNRNKGVDKLYYQQLLEELETKEEFIYEFCKHR